MTRSFPALRPLALLCAFAAVALSGCDSGGPDDIRIGLSGRWAGELANTVDPTQRYPVTMTLVDTRANITGNGTITLPTGALPFAVTSGLYSGGSVTLELNFNRPPQGQLSGNVNATLDQIDGTISGPNLANGTVRLTLNVQRSD